MFTAAGRRRFVMPVLVLLVAGAVYLVQSRTRGPAPEVIATQIERLCAAIVAGRAADDPTGAMESSDIVEARTVETLRLLLDGRPGLATIVVVPGDLPGAPTPASTHVADIGIDGATRLRLRLIAESGVPRPIRLIGFVRPDAGVTGSP
ncbi:MAG: hypothetical protein KDA25_03975 [Phycisphaerales bacterium]|nr:hypothetical protein [Phycisphaerales bacterium]